MSACSSRVSRLSMAECLRYLDGEFYHVERHGGRTLVHVNGYYYASDDEGGGGFRLLEFSGAYLDPAELNNGGCWDESRFSAGIIELSDEELVGRISRDVLGVTCLDIGAVTDSTPEGWYHSPRHGWAGSGDLLQSGTSPGNRLLARLYTSGTIHPR